MNQYRILVVDDEDIPRLTLLRILQLEGFQVTAVGSGEIALLELEKSPFDVMVLDLKMGGMGGVEVLEKVVPAYPNLKIIILTAYASVETAVHALRYRVTDYLQKPLDPEMILVSVRRALGEDSLKGVAEQKTVYDALPSDASQKSVFHLSNGIVIDCMRRSIATAEEKILLTPTEAKVLCILLLNHTLVIYHEDLVQQVYGYRVNAVEAAKILRPLMSRLNKKIIKIPGGKDWIKNIRGSGYLLEIIDTRIESKS